MRTVFSLSFLFLVFLSTSSVQALELPDIDGPDNFWECILDKVPGSSYGVEFRSKVAECRQKFPYNEPLETRDSFFFGLFQYPTAAECVEKYTEDTPNGKARRAIAEACLRLYRKS